MAPVELAHPSEAVLPASTSTTPKNPKTVRTKFATLLDEDAIKVIFACSLPFKIHAPHVQKCSEQSNFETFSINTDSLIWYKDDDRCGTTDLLYREHLSS